MKINKLVISLLIACCSNGFSQNISLGYWRVHLPFNKVAKIVLVKDKFYCATENGLFTYGVSDGSLQRLSKVSGLSDVKISTLNYDSNLDILIIAYENTNLDIIRQNNIFNISDIKKKGMTGSKKINDIYFKDKYAYLSCSFGIIIIDLEKLEIRDTYSNLGTNGEQLSVNTTFIINDTIFIATSKGVFNASMQHPNLLDFEAWSKVIIDDSDPEMKFNLISFFNNKVFASSSSAIYGRNEGIWSKLNISGNAVEMRNYKEEILFTVTDKDYIASVVSLDINENMTIYSNEIINNARSSLRYGNDIWVGDQSNGLVRYIINESRYENYFPNGPESSTYPKIYISGNEVYAIKGYNISFYDQYKWTNIKPNGKTYEFHVAIKNVNDNKLYFGLWGQGLIEISGDSTVKIYDALNSIIKPTLGDNYSLITGLEFDSQENLWMLNQGTKSPVLVKTKDSLWYGFYLPEGYNFYQLTDILIGNVGHVWAVIREDNGGGILVINHNNTISNFNDDKWKWISDAAGSGGLTSKNVQVITKDNNGDIWVGTDDGINIFYNPENIFDAKEYDSKCPVFEQQCLLKDQLVKAITVDAANRKWVGTTKGVWLFDEDGTKRILNFNTSNSPILSDNIYDIAINNNNGEVFFSTDQGIISYRGTAVTGLDKHQTIKIFPNPVPPDYEGIIAIEGTANNSTIKITDIAGRLVYETKSLGGMAIWDGKDINQNKVYSGIYLIFLSNADGSDIRVAKLAFIR